MNNPLYLSKHAVKILLKDAFNKDRNHVISQLCRQIQPSRNGITLNSIHKQTKLTTEIRVELNNAKSLKKIGGFVECEQIL